MFGLSERGIRVAEVPDGPAARAGLRPDDQLIAIDAQPVSGLPIAEVQKRLSGEVGSIVKLTVERDGTLIDLPVERAPYQNRTR